MAAARSAAALIATAVALALIVLTPQAAFAHPGHGSNGPQAVEARPAPGEVVAQRIDSVEVDFSGPLTEGRHAIEVTAPNGRRVSTGDTRLTTPMTLQTSIKDLTQAGTYNVTVTVAGHEGTGSYDFTFQPPAKATTGSGTAKTLILAAWAVALVALIAGATVAIRRRRAAAAAPARAGDRRGGGRA